MAELVYIAPVSAVALTLSTTKTLVQVVAPATREVRVKEFAVSFDGVDATKAPFLVQLLRQTSAGTSSALTIAKGDSTNPAALSSALQTFTAEPTGTTDILWAEYISPAGGFDRIQLPLSEEFVMNVSERVGLRVVTPSVAANATAYIRFAE